MIKRPHRIGVAAVAGPALSGSKSPTGNQVLRELVSHPRLSTYVTLAGPAPLLATDRSAR